MYTQICFMGTQPHGATVPKAYVNADLHAMFFSLSLSLMKRGMFH